MLSVIYAVCRWTECRYAERRSAHQTIGQCQNKKLKPLAKLGFL
jgi:hypothetical protein